MKNFLIPAANTVAALVALIPDEVCSTVYLLQVAWSFIIEHAVSSPVATPSTATDDTDVTVSFYILKNYIR